MPDRTPYTDQVNWGGGVASPATNEQNANVLAAARQVVHRQLDRAGIGNDVVDRSAITQALLAPAPTDEQKVLLKDFSRIVSQGDPRHSENYETPEEASLREANSSLGGDIQPEHLLYGLDSRNIRAKQFEDIKGPGITQSDIDANGGRQPLPRELYTQGARQFNEQTRDSELLQGLADGQKHNSQIPRIGAAQFFHDSEGQKFGESGFMGAAENSEYIGGNILEDLNVPYTAVSSAVNGPAEDQLLKPDTFPGNWMTGFGRGAINSVANIPDALSVRSSNQDTNKVSPLLPKGPDGTYPDTPRERILALEALRKQQEDIRPRSTDMSIRHETGQYPSFGYKHMVDFAQNMADPSLLWTLPRLAGATMKAAAKSSAKAGYGFLRNAARIAEPIGQEAAEEGLGYGAIVGAMSNQDTGDQPVGKTPSIMDWFKPGNEARTDLYIQGSADADKMVPVPDEQFEESATEQRDGRNDALRAASVRRELLPKWKVQTDSHPLTLPPAWSSSK